MGKAANIVFLDMRGQTVFVEYIGKTDEYQDVLYGTGLWAKHQIKEVLSEPARKMLEHPDQYVEVDIEALDTDSPPAGPVGEIRTKQEDEDSIEQRARDVVARMGKDEIKQYVLENFRVSMDARKGIESLRQQAIQLIDQFGVN